MLETSGVVVDDALLEGWRARVALARSRLGWTTHTSGTPARDTPASAATVARRHAGGVSLALAAPVDQLFTATEVNEWAWCATLVERDPALLQPLQAALVQAAIEQAATLSDIADPVLEQTAALDRLRRLADAERRPALRALLMAAHARDLPHVLDEQELTLGTGAGGYTWPLDALPQQGDVEWAARSAVPVAVVTGSNGKTTTTRLLAACAQASGRVAGYCCTDGIFVGGELVEAGDYSGPAGTRRVLRDGRVESAVLETARGAILRRGLAIDRADVAVVTNISSDHFGEYGIDDLDGLADTKLTVAQLVCHRGLLVLNADDPLLCAKARQLHARLGTAPTFGWFSVEFARAERAAVASGTVIACGVQDGRLLLAWRGERHDLGEVASMPISVGARATYNVANLAGAAVAARGLGTEIEVVRAVFGSFGRDPADNAGRLMCFEVAGVLYLVDYAHNPDGLRGVLGVAQAMQRERRSRLITLLGHAGNRRDADIAEVARVAASFRPDYVVVKEDEHHLRGRAPGVVPAILRSALLAGGISGDAIVLSPSEIDAARLAMTMGRPGDVVVLLMHASSARTAVLDLLRGH